MKKFLLFLLILILLIAGGLAYTGLIPGLSSVIGTDKPRDLGIKFDQNTIDVMTARSGTTFTTSSSDSIKTESESTQSASEDEEITNGSLANSGLIFTGKKDITFTMTSEEISAFGRDRGWPNYPVKDLQIKINPDGSVETSGIARLSRIAGFMSVAGNHYGIEVEKFIQESLKLPLADVPFYASGKISITDNVVSAQVSKVEVGRLPVPQSIINKYNGEFVNFANQEVKLIPNLNVKSANFDGGKLNFEGTIPDKLTVITK